MAMVWQGHGWWYMEVMDLFSIVCMYLHCSTYTCMFVTCKYFWPEVITSWEQVCKIFLSYEYNYITSWEQVCKIFLSYEYNYGKELQISRFMYSVRNDTSPHRSVNVHVHISLRPFHNKQIAPQFQCKHGLELPVKVDKVS